MSHYIYAIKINGVILYVGRTHTLFQRILQHITNSNVTTSHKLKINNPLYLHLNKMISNGMYPSFMILEKCTIDDSHKREAHHIRENCSTSCFNTPSYYHLDSCDWNPKKLGSRLHELIEDVFIDVAKQLEVLR